VLVTCTLTRSRLQIVLHNVSTAKQPEVTSRDDQKVTNVSESYRGIFYSQKLRNIVIDTKIVLRNPLPVNMNSSIVCCAQLNFKDATMITIQYLCCYDYKRDMIIPQNIGQQSQSQIVRAQ
jgi:hypothetical protein